jgi:hypothetical protein
VSISRRTSDLNPVLEDATSPAAPAWLSPAPTECQDDLSPAQQVTAGEGCHRWPLPAVHGSASFKADGQVTADGVATDGRPYPSDPEKGRAAAGEPIRTARWVQRQAAGSEVVCRRREPRPAGAEAAVRRAPVRVRGPALVRVRAEVPVVAPARLAGQVRVLVREQAQERPEAARWQEPVPAGQVLVVREQARVRAARTAAAARAVPAQALARVLAPEVAQVRAPRPAVVRLAQVPVPRQAASGCRAARPAVWPAGRRRAPSSS